MLDGFDKIDRNCPEPSVPEIHDFPEMPRVNLEKEPRVLEGNVPEQPAGNNENNLPVPVGGESVYVKHVVGQVVEESPKFDQLTAHYATVAKLYRIIAAGGKLKPEDIGYDAGCDVLGQYYAAKAEVSHHWGPAITAAVGVAVLAAGIAVDISIFGGAAEKMMTDNHWFSGLAVGSLIFAAGTSLLESSKLKILMRGIMMAASLGASMLAADNHDFKMQFANMLPDSMRASVHKADAGVEKADAHIVAARERLERDRKTLMTGGDGGKPILGDRYKGNDAQGHELEKVTIPADELALQSAQEEKAVAISTSKVENANDPAKWWGQILGALYLGSWLIAAQFGIAGVLDLARRQNKDSSRRMKEMRVANLQSSRGTAEARVQVHEKLRTYHDSMVHACMRHPVAAIAQARLAEVDQMFSGESLKQATNAGVSYVTAAIHPRRQLFEDGEPRGFWAFVSGRKNRTSPSPKP